MKNKTLKNKIIFCLLTVISISLCIVGCSKETKKYTKVELVNGTGEMQVTVSYDLDYNDSVGDDWYNEYDIQGISPIADQINTYKVKSGDTISIKTTITEHDSVNDIKRAYSNKTVSESDIINGFTIEQTVIVRENKGRYSGNTAKWIVTYKFNPTKPYYIPDT